MQSVLFRSVFVGLSLVSSLLACGPSAVDAPASEAAAPAEALQPPDLSEVTPPPDLGQLDLAVREQFAEFWGELQASPEVGAAWGTLGQWFDVYSYADSAALCYRAAQQLEPYEARWPYYLGRLAEEGGDLTAAHEAYERAAELAPGSVAPRVRLGDLWLQQQRLERAELRYREALAMQPDSSGARLGLARLALMRGDAAAALPLLQELEAAQPEAVEVQYSLGLAWRQLGDETRSADHFGRVPEENLDQIPLTRDAPWDVELQRLDRGARSLTQRGVRAFRRGERAAAVVLFGRAVTADPEGPEKRVNYGVALRETGNWHAAEEQFRRALELAPAGSEIAAKAHLELGRLLARGRPLDARTQLEAVLQLDANSIPAHLELGRIYHRRGELEAALGHYEAVWRQQASDVEGSRFWYAGLLSALGRYEEALEVLRTPEDRFDDERAAGLLLARLLSAAPDSELRDAARARRLLESALPPAAPPTVDVLFAETAAMVAAEEGRFSDAVAWQRAAVDVLEAVRPRSAAHTARRRLVLYERGDACRTPWEPQETLIQRPVEPPSGVGF